MNENKKNIYKKQGVGIIIGSIIALLLIFIPYSVQPFSLVIGKLPLFGSGEGVLSYDICKESITTCLFVFNIDKLLNGFTIPMYSYIMLWGSVAYFFIMFIMLVFGIVFMATKGKGRKLFKVISVTFGIILCFMTIAYFSFTIGTIVNAIENATLNEIDFDRAILNNNFVLYGLAGTILSIVMAIKFFKWFHKED